MNSTAILQNTSNDLGLARPTGEHVLYMADTDGSVVRHNSGPGTEAGYQALQEEADNMFCQTWVVFEEFRS